MSFEKMERAVAVLSVARQLVDEKTASIAPELYDRLKEDGSLVKRGTRINWNGVLKKAAVDLWDTKENNPDNAPTLWEDIQYRAGHRIIPAVITVTSVFSKDETGWWGDVLYRSVADNNVYTPEQYPPNWEVVNDHSEN